MMAEKGGLLDTPAASYHAQHTVDLPGYITTDEANPLWRGLWVAAMATVGFFVSTFCFAAYVTISTATFLPVEQEVTTAPVAATTIDTREYSVSNERTGRKVTLLFTSLSIFCCFSR